MPKCCNENCRREVPEYGAVLISCDGDFVCNEKCKREYEGQRDRFFSNLENPNFNLGDWMTGV